MNKSQIMLVLGGILVGIGGRGIVQDLMKSPKMPPGYFLQTDGHYWRWYAIERGGWWTNQSEFDSRNEAYKNASGVARINSAHHEWKDTP